ncbi:ankyrin repeat domain-containing protein [bacterium]|nr:ankyrin repeat domain-containing protein [bacterium]MDB4668658.1 ankyrin repeat domain-containing protein [bacterium]
MKHILITIAAVMLVACAASKKQNIWEDVVANDTDTIVMLIALGQNVNAKDDDGSTPLHYASAKSNKEVTELLIVESADVNAKDEDGETPLDFANKVKRFKTAALLRKHGGKTGEELKAAGN